MRKSILLFTALSLMVATAVAQRSPRPSLADAGWYETTSVGMGHDSFAGWSSEMDSAIGYSFNTTWSMEAGAPFYLLTTSQTQSGATTTTTHHAAIGDAFIRMKAIKKADALNYAGALTATAPTGDTNAGVSTGRATITWNNRLEHAFDHVTPFGEASLGNSLSSTRLYRRDYTTLGAVSEFRGGAGFDLLKNLSVEASGFGDVGYGNQKMFSRSVRKGTSVLPGTAATHNRFYQAAYLTTGTAGLVDDKGFTGEMAWSPMPRVVLDMAYTRSVHFAANSISASVAFRFGHMPPKPAKQ